MRVLFDARMLYHSGIGRYLRNLCSQLSKGDFDIDIILAGDKEKINRFEEGSQIKIGEKKMYNTPIYSLREQIAGSWIVNRYKNSVDIFHYPHFNIPWFISGKEIVTFHDLIHLRFPEYFGRLKVSVARHQILRVLKNAKKVIAVSESTERDLISLDHNVSDKIRVIYNGVSEFFKPLSRDHINSFLEKKGLGRYILYVGNRKPHKNLSGVLSTFSSVKNRFQDLKLVIIGDKKDETEEVREKIKELGNKVIDIEYANDNELLKYYNGARVFFYPSLYEGFGFTPLEAMASGTPVITSNTSSLPEVVSNAAIMIDPNKNTEMVNALVRILESNNLRTELTEKGLKRAALFKWERCVEETYEIYRELVNI